MLRPGAAENHRAQRIEIPPDTVSAGSVEAFPDHLPDVGDVPGGDDRGTGRARRVEAAVECIIEQSQSDPPDLADGRVATGKSDRTERRPSLETLVIGNENLATPGRSVGS